MKRMILWTLSAALCSTLASCAHHPLDARSQQAAGDKAVAAPNTATLNQDSLHFYVSQLARQLFASANQMQFNEAVAVGSFLPIDDIEGKNVPPSFTLGQQIQESFVTLATQAGLTVVEFKTTSTIKLDNNLDIMLSRDLKKINPNIEIDYFLTGTYSFQQTGLAVNARLIDASTSNVIAAATDLIPRYLLHSAGNQVVQHKPGTSHQLYHLK